MYSTFKQRPIGPPLAGIVAVVALLLLWPTPPAAQESTPTLDDLTLSAGGTHPVLFLDYVRVRGGGPLRGRNPHRQRVGIVGSHRQLHIDGCQ